MLPVAKNCNRPNAACLVLLVRTGLAGNPAKPVGTSQPGIVFPCGSVVVVDTFAPNRIAHVWPVVLIEAWCVFQAVPVGIKDEALVYCIEAQSSPRHGEQLFPHPQETAERQYSVRNLAAGSVQHDFLDVTQVFVLRVIHVVADECICTHQPRPRAAVSLGSEIGPSLVHTVLVAFFKVHSALLARGHR
ncbi:hypothetical protein J518_4156 [Acinetobacter baumannii 1419130]|nr:hypothetical protein J518_4156 [Acinetobacter baumannii 1419130]